MNRKLILFISVLFIFRIIYGLSSEFWFVDELQIYLIGLKSFTTGTWPYFGPDIVYTNTQIPGALQGLLVSFPFHFLKIPEAPSLFVNLLSIGSLSLLAHYTSKRITSIPKMIVWGLVLTTPWALHYSTRVINPSYVLIFAIPFFLSTFDLFPIYKDKVIPKKLGVFLIGLCTTLIMQLHMSWVLLLPFIGVAFLYHLKEDIKTQALFLSLFSGGLILGALTLIPTWLLDSSANLQSNLVFNMDNWKNFPTVVTRYFSLASFEIPYVLGANTEERLNILYTYWWMIPFAAFLLLVGFAQVGTFIVYLIKKSNNAIFQKFRIINALTIIALFCSFFFSVKGPASHTYYILFPIVIFYSFLAYERLINKYNWMTKLLYVIMISGFIFHLGLGMNNYRTKSLYKDRDKVVKALEEMDYKILGTRRADNWGYGY